MNNLKKFNFNNNELQVIANNGEVWFIAKDVCNILGIAKHRSAVSRLDDDERGSVLVDTLGGKQSVSSINESGLYSLVLGSRKPEAKQFKKWVTSEVLPAIRKTGKYQIELTAMEQISHALQLSQNIQGPYMED